MVSVSLHADWHTHIYIYIYTIFLFLSIFIYMRLVYLTLYTSTSAQIDLILTQWLQPHTCANLRRIVSSGDLEIILYSRQVSTRLTYIFTCQSINGCRTVLFKDLWFGTLSVKHLFWCIVLPILPSRTLSTPNKYCATLGSLRTKRTWVQKISCQRTFRSIRSFFKGKRSHLWSALTR